MNCNILTLFFNVYVYIKNQPCDDYVKYTYIAFVQHVHDNIRSFNTRARCCCLIAINTV